MKKLHLFAFGILFIILFGCSDQKPAEKVNNDIPQQSLPGRYEFVDEVAEYDLFNKTLKKAEQGDPDAQNALASMYHMGKGVPQDFGKATEWYRKAAEQGHARAQFTLALMYDGGKGVPQDFGKAIEWLQKAAEQGEPAAQIALALKYEEGDGMSQDFGKAFEWWEKAAEQGDKSAQFILADMYEEGKGVPQDFGKAIEWLQKAVEQGDTFAQFRLANMYYEGKGVLQDFSKAVEWYRKAAEQGHSGAQYNLALMYNDGKGVPQDFNKAVVWYQKAAEQGYADAQNNLALMYYKGKGVPKDQVLAYAWANLSTVQENTPDIKLRDIIAENATPAEIAEGQRLSSNWKPGMILARENPGNANTSTTPAKGNENAPIKYMTGTGFIISEEGHILTNNHVVESCRDIRITGTQGIIKILATDVVNDLALLQIDTKVDDYALLESDTLKLKQGEDIIVFGYPLNSVLSSSGNLTPGTISALTGLGNNTNQLQITAPIQPGSSGSPVINKKGYIVGIVSMKLSDGYIANATGSIPQNVNFAVNLQTIKSFLDINKVPYETGSKIFSLSKNSTEIAEEAKKWTLIIENWK